MQLRSSRAVVVGGIPAEAVYIGGEAAYSSDLDETANGLFVEVQPQDAVAAGRQAQFVALVTAAGGGTVTYQWQRHAASLSILVEAGARLVAEDASTLVAAGGVFVDIAGASSATLSLAGLTKSGNDGDAYRAVVTGSLGQTVTTRAALLAVDEPLIISAQPTDQVAADREATFSVVAAHDGGLAIQYQWQQSSDGVAWLDVAGGTSASLTQLVEYDANGRRYRVRVSSSDGEQVTSSHAVLTVPPTPIVITQQPTNQNGNTGSASFVVSAERDVAVLAESGSRLAAEDAAALLAASSSAGLSYQWQELMGGEWVSVPGQTQPTLALTGLAEADGGRQFRARVSAGVHYAISNAAMLSVDYVPDGPEWTQRSMPVLQPITNSSDGYRSLAFGGGKFLAFWHKSGGTSHSTTSSDGRSWTSAQALPIADRSVHSLVYGNGEFVTAYSLDNRLSRSVDGVAWTAVALPSGVYPVTSLKVVAPNTQYGTHTYFAFVNNGEQVHFSTDLSTWSSLSLPSHPNFATDGSVYQWSDIEFGEGKGWVVTASKFRIASDGIAFYNADTVAWRSSLTSGAAWGRRGVAGEWQSIAFGNGVFVAAAKSSNSVATSSNGSTWSLRSNVLPFYGSWTVRFGNGKFVAVSGNVSAESTNGTSWVTKTMPGTGWVNVRYGNNVWVAVNKTHAATAAF